MNIAEENGTASVPVTTGAPVLPSTLGYGQIPAAKRSEIPIPFTGTDTLFALLFLVCGYLFVWLITPECFGLGVTLFTAAFCTLVLLYLKNRGKPVPKNSWFWLALVVLSSVNFSLFTNVSLQFLNFLFLMGCAVYWVAVLTSGRMEERLGACFMPDMVNQLFKIPFLNFGCASKIIRRSAVKNKKSRVLLASLGGALAALPVLWIVLSLLMQADGAFQALVKQFSADVGTHIVNFLFRLLPAFLTGSYLFGLLYGNIQKRRADSITAEKAAKFSEKCRVVPTAAAVTGIVLLCILYLIFFGAQTASLFSAFSGQGQNGLTLAEFARRGFFELCKVATINFAVITFSSVLIRREEGEFRLMRAIHIFLSTETLLLIASALSKMILYIARYGLTPKRVYTSWFMAVLAVIFVLIIVSRFKKINLARSIVLTCAVSFLILCYANIDGRIVRYNIGRYQSGTLETVDVGIMYGAPDAAKPYALELYRNTKDASLKKDLENFLRDQNPQKIEFQQMNLQKWTALRLPME
ncbi:DUF4153 domain-containing protein [Caproiciproducens sp. R2]|uniref:DUF4153 domain-containing protein n=1 Tax=Caproiciproducens sp. R2 TaxID=3435187 RepID=UPI0040334549